MSEDRQSLLMDAEAKLSKALTAAPEPARAHYFMGRVLSMTNGSRSRRQCRSAQVAGRGGFDTAMLHWKVRVLPGVQARRLVISLAALFKAYHASGRIAAEACEGRMSGPRSLRAVSPSPASGSRRC
jgi:hypothetical protein